MVVGEEREGGKKASGSPGEESSPAACNTPAVAIGGVATTEIGSGDVRNDTRFVLLLLLTASDSLTARTVKRLSYKKNKGEKSSGSSRNQSDVR